MNINTVEYWNKKHIKNYNNRYISLPRRLYHNFVMSNINDNGKLVDVGCGNGLFVEDALNNTKNIELYGIDFSDKVIGENKKYFSKYSVRNRQIVFITDNIESITDKYSNFDYVVCMEVLEHITDYKNLLNQLNSICSENGKIFITIPNKRSIISDEHVHYFESKQIYDDIQRIGTIIKYDKLIPPGSKNVRNLLFCYKPNK